MSGIVSWLMSILAIVVLGTIIDLILPNGRMGKFIKTIFASITILIIIMPLPSLISGDFDLNSDLFFDYEVELDSNYLNYTEKLKISYLEDGLIDQLESDGFYNVTVSIDADIVGSEITTNFVTLNIENLVLNSEMEHIDKYTQLRELASEYLSISDWQVIING